MRYAREHDFDGPIALASVRYRVPVALIKAIVAKESAFNPSAINLSDPGYAWGLMQMIPSTARGLGYTGAMQGLIDNPGLAIDLGTRLLQQNLGTSGSVADSVSAYNGGWRPTLGYGRPLPSGRYANQAYVDQVLALVQYFQGGTPADQPGNFCVARRGDDWCCVAPGTTATPPIERRGRGGGTGQKAAFTRHDDEHDHELRRII